MTPEEENAVKRHVDYMMYQAFKGALRCVNARMQSEPTLGMMFYEWLDRWKAEQAAQDAEKARAVANFRAMVKTESESQNL